MTGGIPWQAPYPEQRPVFPVRSPLVVRRKLVYIEWRTPAPGTPGILRRGVETKLTEAEFRRSFNVEYLEDVRLDHAGVMLVDGTGMMRQVPVFRLVNDHGHTCYIGSPVLMPDSVITLSTLKVTVLELSTLEDLPAELKSPLARWGGCGWEFLSQELNCWVPYGVPETCIVDGEPGTDWPEYLRRDA